MGGRASYAGAPAGRSRPWLKPLILLDFHELVRFHKMPDGMRNGGAVLPAGKSKRFVEMALTLPG